VQDGLLRVILDGGPSRVFFPGDAKLLEEDLEALKVSYSNHLNVKRIYNLQQANQTFGLYCFFFNNYNNSELELETYQ
jgi:hypothetical protein